MGNDKLIAVRLPSALVSILDNRVAQERGTGPDGVWRDCSRSLVMRRALRQYLKKDGAPAGSCDELLPTERQ